MGAQSQPDVVCGGDPDPQGRLPLVANGVQRFVCRMAYGDILIEIRDGAAYVNGARVTPVSETAAATSSCSQALAPQPGEADSNRRGP
jgi:hypothetical protein